MLPPRNEHRMRHADAAMFTFTLTRHFRHARRLIRRCQHTTALRAAVAAAIDVYAAPPRYTRRACALLTIYVTMFCCQRDCYQARLARFTRARGAALMLLRCRYAGH